MVQGEISEADTPTIRLGSTPSTLISDPPSSFPIFTPDALPATTLPILSWLGTGTKYAGYMKVNQQPLQCRLWSSAHTKLMHLSAKS